MKIFRSIILFVVLLTLVAFTGAWFYVKANGKQLASQLLTKTFERPVLIGSVNYIFPQGLSLTNIQIGNEFLAEKAVANLTLRHLLKGNIIISELTCYAPILKFNKVSNITAIPEQNMDLSKNESSTPDLKNVEPQRFSDINVYIAEFKVRNGQIHYQNHSVDKRMAFHLNNVALDMKKIKFPLQSLQSPFEMSATLQKEGSPLEGGQLKADGWIDFMAKDLDARFEVSDKQQDVGLSAHAVSQDNDMKVNGEFNLHQVSVGSKAQRTSSVDDLILGALSNAGVSMGAKFSFDTKFDNPQITNVQFKGSIITK